MAEQNEIRKIMVLEDEIIWGLALTKMLKKNGYDVLTATSFVDATAKYSDDLDLLVSDIEVGDSYGPHLFREFKRWKPSMKVIYMSGHGKAELVKTGLLTEEDMFLEKPFPPKELLEVIKELKHGRD